MASTAIRPKSFARFAQQKDSDAAAKVAPANSSLLKFQRMSHLTFLSATCEEPLSGGLQFPPGCKHSPDPVEPAPGSPRVFLALT